MEPIENHHRLVGRCVETHRSAVRRADSDVRTRAARGAGRQDVDPALPRVGLQRRLKLGQYPRLSLKAHGRDVELPEDRRRRRPAGRTAGARAAERARRTVSASPKCIEACALERALARRSMRLKKGRCAGADGRCRRSRAATAGISSRRSPRGATIVAGTAALLSRLFRCAVDEDYLRESGNASAEASVEAADG